MKEMDMEKNIMEMVNKYLRVNIYMDKKEKEKNILINF